ncbi:MAG: hypothetical protein ACRD8U_10155 [Pyrinomonadaceae bacterium]
MKDPSHLKDKLIRKLLEARESGTEFDINENNLLLRINDLGGYRILHLHTRQMEEIHNALLELLDVAQCDLFEPPFANIWDDESRAYFEGAGINRRQSSVVFERSLRDQASEQDASNL